MQADAVTRQFCPDWATGLPAKSLLLSDSAQPCYLKLHWLHRVCGAGPVNARIGQRNMKQIG